MGHKSIGTHWIALYMNDDNIFYFHRLWTIPKFHGNKISYQIFIEYRQMVQQREYIFVLNLLVLY